MSVYETGYDESNPLDFGMEVCTGAFQSFRPTVREANVPKLVEKPKTIDLNNSFGKDIFEVVLVPEQQVS